MSVSLTQWTIAGKMPKKISAGDFFEVNRKKLLGMSSSTQK